MTERCDYHRRRRPGGAVVGVIGDVVAVGVVAAETDDCAAKLGEVESGEHGPARACQVVGTDMVTEDHRRPISVKTKSGAIVPPEKLATALIHHS